MKSKGTKNYYQKKSNGSKSGKQYNPKDNKKNPRNTESNPEDSSYDPRATHNDVNWYVENDQMLKDVASLPFGHVLGLETGFIDTSNPAYGSRMSKYIPGVAEIRLEPSLGCPKKAVDGATLAARRIYTFVRHANSGSANYESADLFMMIVAHASATAWLASLKRVYGLAQQYYHQNRYFSDTVIRACGFKPEVVYNNLNDIRSLINISEMRLNSIKVPKDMPFRTRWEWLNSNVFMDDDSIKAQVYVPHFMNYLKWEGYKSENGTSLELVAPKYNAVGNAIVVTEFEDIVTFTNFLIDPIMSEEDIGIMSGDILKAYGDNVSVQSLIDSTYIVMPSYDADVLTQIHNIVSFPGIETSYNHFHYIGQEFGEIVERYHFNATSGARTLFDATGKYYFDTYSTDPGPAIVMVGTRLMPTFYTFSGSSEYDTAVDACGTEIPVGIRIHTTTQGDFEDVSNIVDASSEAGVRQVVEQTCFNWHPVTYVMYNDKFVNILGDVENYTTVAYDKLNMMHRNATFSIFRTGTGK